MTSGERQYTDQVHWATRWSSTAAAAATADNMTADLADSTAAVSKVLVGLVAMSHENLSQIITSIAARNGRDISFKRLEDPGHPEQGGVDLKGKSDRYHWGQFINLEIPVLVTSRKSINVAFG